MSLLISRLVFTIIVIAVAYFALFKIWTKTVDVTELLKQPSKAIPIAKTEIRPELAIHLRFPYEKTGDSVKLNRRNPLLEITNRGTEKISPVRVSVTMYTIDDKLEKIESAGYLQYRSHGRLIFEPELNPGASVSASLPGVMNWDKSAVYQVKIEGFTIKENPFPDLTVYGLIDKEKVKIEHKGLTQGEVKKIREAIAIFEKNKNPNNRLELNAVAEGTWLATPGKDSEAKVNEDGTISFREKTDTP